MSKIYTCRECGNETTSQQEGEGYCLSCRNRAMEATQADLVRGATDPRSGEPIDRSAFKPHLIGGPDSFNRYWLNVGGAAAQVNGADLDLRYIEDYEKDRQ